MDCFVRVSQQGWTDRSIAFILQVCMANASAGGGVIVVLASGGEKVAVERRFKASVAVEHLYGTKVVFRSGSPQNVHDLRQCNAAHAKSIVILSIGLFAGLSIAGPPGVVAAIVISAVYFLAVLPHMASRAGQPRRWRLGPSRP